MYKHFFKHCEQCGGQLLYILWVCAKFKLQTNLNPVKTDLNNFLYKVIKLTLKNFICSWFCTSNKFIYKLTSIASIFTNEYIHVQNNITNEIRLCLYHFENNIQFMNKLNKFMNTFMQQMKCVIAFTILRIN